MPIFLFLKLKPSLIPNSNTLDRILLFPPMGQNHRFHPFKIKFIPQNLLSCYTGQLLNKYGRQRSGRKTMKQKTYVI